MTIMDKLTIIYDPCFLDHDTGSSDHPELPVRLQTILTALKDSSCSSSLVYALPVPASRDLLLQFHAESWLFRFEEAVLSGQTFIDHTDNQIGYESYSVALMAAGAGISAIDRIEKGETESAFCLVRPPGHHAEKNMPFGFCFLNNCVIAARYWGERYGRKRLAIFDFDAHHGNGIQSAFEHEEDSLYISIHEHPSFSYPGTGYNDEKGLGKGMNSILNLTLSPGAGDEQVLQLLDQKVESKLREWQPDALIVAAGFDGHIKDDMSGLHCSTELYGEIGRRVREMSKLYCHGRLLSILEGGYELSVLGESVESYIQGLLRVMAS